MRVNRNANRRKWLFGVVLAMLACIVPGAAAGAEAPLGAEEWCGHYYKVFKDQVSVTEAKAKCEAMGGYLVTLSSKGESNFVDDLRANSGMADSLRVEERLWCGAVKTSNESEWSWMNGEEYLFGYSVWALDKYTDANGESGYAGGTSFPIYHSIGNVQSNALYFTSRGENLQKVKHGYICEWGHSLDIAPAQVALSQSDFTYNGRGQMPGVTVTYQGITLEEKYDYELLYSDNINIGEAKVTVKGKGRFNGEISCTYRINPPQVKNVKASKDTLRRLEAEWGSVQDATSYEIWCSKDKEFEVDVLKYKEGGLKLQQGQLMERNTTYYVKVRALADGKTSTGQTLEGKWSSTVSVNSGKLLSTADFWGFRNSGVSYQMGDFQRFFEEEKARELFEKCGSSDRMMCFGMTLGALSVLYEQMPALESFTDNSLNKVHTTGYQIPGLDMTAGQFIKYAYVWQYTQAMQEEADAGVNDANGLYKAVKAYLNGGAPVMVVMNEEDHEEKRGHIVCVTGIKKETDQEVQFTVYDSNAPYPANAVDSSILHFYRTGGRFTSYQLLDSAHYPYFLGTFSDEDDCRITYLTAAPKHFAADFKKGISGQQDYLVTVENAAKENAESMTREAFGKETARIRSVEGGETAESTSDTYLYWVDAKSSFTLRDVPAGVKVKVTSDHKSVSVQADVAGSYTINLADGKDSAVKAQLSTQGMVKAEFSEIPEGSSTVTTQTVAGSGSAGQEIKVEEKNGAVQLSGATRAQMSREMGTLTNSGVTGTQEKKVEVPALEAGKTYQFSSTESGLEVKGSSQNNGVFDEAVQTGAGAGTGASANALKVNGAYTSGTLKYKVTKLTGKTGTATVTGPKSKSAAAVVVPATVKINGVTLTVNAVGAGAFQGMAKLKSAAIGKNVAKIGQLAFYGDKKLAKITVNSTLLKSVGKNAVKGIYAKAKIVVPAAKVSAYKKLFSTAAGRTSKMTVASAAGSRTWKVTFKNGAKTVKTQSVANGKAATAPKLTKKGYILSWSASFKKVTKNLTVRAIWTPEVPKKGYAATVGSLKYKVTRSAKTGGTVQVTGVLSRSLTAYAVPAAVKIGKTTFAVTGIAAGAFTKCSKAKIISLPKSITSIGKKAFTGTKTNVVVTVPRAQYTKLAKLLKSAGLSAKAVIWKK